MNYIDIFLFQCKTGFFFILYMRLLQHREFHSTNKYKVSDQVFVVFVV